MNTLVKTALDKLIQDETFRSELESMLEGVNRATDTHVSREQATEPEPTTERAATEPTASNFTDIKEELLADQAFLKALVNALMDASAPADEERAQQDKKLFENIEALERTVKELNTTINEHDKVLTNLAEKTLIQEGSKPVLLRARTEQPAKSETEPTPLQNRAARVLTKMGGQNA